jgi:hypothetical protein
MRRYSQVFLVLALFCFLFPFVVISPAKNAGVLQMTGWEMLTSQNIGVSKQPPLILHVPPRIPVLLALLCGAMAIIVRFARRDEIRWVVTAGSIAAAISLLAVTGSNLPVELTDGQKLVYLFDSPAVQFLPGFYVALALLGAAAVSSVLNQRKQLAVAAPTFAQPVSSVIPESVAASSFCIKCGHGLLAGAKFCNRCGAVVALPIPKAAEAAAVASQAAMLNPIVTPAPAITPSPVRPAAAPVAAIPTPLAPNRAMAKPAPPKRQFSLGAKLAFAAAALAVAVGIWYGVHPGSDSASVAPTTVLISPAYIRVAPGGSVELQASVNGGTNRDVEWQVEEGSSAGTVEPGGAVVRNGNVFVLATYRAPARPGTYHISAISTADHTRKGVAQVIVEHFAPYSTR